MADQRAFAKDPLTPCHGDSLVDQSFQSLKSKEVRDSMSPTHDMKFHSLSLNHPNSAGWDVQSSSEVRPDGRARRSETIAKTEGVENIDGGVAAYRGHNEQRSSASHEGDDQNYVKKASESSKTHLQENVVIGDSNSGRTEIKSSSKTSSSSQVISSSSTVYHDDAHDSSNNYLMDDQFTERQREQQHYRQQQQQEHLQSRKVDQSEISKHHHQQTTEQYNRNQQEMSTNTQLTAEQIREDNKHYVDMDKISPEYQERVRFLMAQPGEIISNTVEYPKPNVKMITTVKRLPDGTVVKNKRYETEELEPTSGSIGHQRLVSKELNQSNKQTTTQRRSQDQENIYTRLQNTRNTPTNRPRDDSTDNVGKIQGASPMQEPSNRFPGQSQAVDAIQEDVSNISTFSSSKIQKSSKRFSTETTSETIEEIEDRPLSNRPSIRPKSRESQDFTTHGFPSVRSPTRATHVYPNGGPQKPREDNRKPSQDFTTHGFPSVRSNMPTQEYPTDRPQVARGLDYRNPRPSGAQPGNKSSPQYVPVDGEVVVVSETKNSSNYKTNTEHVVETEIITDRDYPRGGPRPGDADTRPDFSTHGFPSVKMESPQKTPSSPVEKIHRPSQSNTKPDFSTHGFPSVRESGKTKPDFSTHGFPSVRETSPQRGESPRPSHYSSSPRQSQPREDFSTNGFPSVKSPLKEAAPRTAPHSSSPRQSQPREDFSTNGFPSVKMPTKESPVKGYQNAKEIPIVMETQAPLSTQRKSQVPTSSGTSVKKQNTSTATKVTTVRKEKEVDAAHRAFAASLRSSSPADSIRRDSNTDQQPRHSSPRSSLASSRASHRREVREGSHDSLAASETSRFSSNTVTRQSPSKVIPKTSLPKHTITKPGRDTPQRFTTKSHSPSPSPSPSPSSPSKTITSSTRVKKVAADVPAPEKSPISPTSSSSKPSRTSPKKQYPAAVRDDLSEGNSEIIDEITYPSDSETNVSEYFHQEDKQNITQDFLDTKTITRDTNFEKTDDYEADHDKKPSRKGPKSVLNESPSILRSGIPKVVQREDDLTSSFNKTRTNQQTKDIKTVADDFITNESVKQPCYPDDELPDGAFISKPNEPEMDKPSSPTYKKKGLSRHETFEERCRQILGMEEFGDTQGTYTTRRDLEPVVSRQPKQDKPPQLIRPTDQSLVRIEDCEDDETNYTSEPSYRKPGKELPSKPLSEETPQYTQRDTKSTNVSGSNVSESSTTFIDNEKNVKVTRPRTSPERPLAFSENVKKPIDKTPNKPSPGPHDKTTSRRTSNTVDVRETKRDVIEYDSEISLTEEEAQDYNDRTSTTQQTFESSLPNQNKKRSPDRKPSPVSNNKYPTNEKPSSCKIPTNKKKTKEEVVVTITTTEKPKAPKDTEDFPKTTLKVYENDSDESGPDNQEMNIRINHERDYNNTTKIDYSTSKALHTSDHFDETRTSSPERRYSPEPNRPSADTRRQPETSQRKPSPVHSPERKHSPKRITKGNVSNEQSRRVETTSKLTKKYVNEERKTHSPEREQPYEVCSSPEPKRTPQGKQSLQRQNIPQRRTCRERYDSPESKGSPERTHSPQRQHLPRRELIPKRVQTAQPKTLPEKILPERKTSAPIKKQPQYNKQSPKRSPQSDHVTEYTVGIKHVSQHKYSEERESSTNRKCSPKRVQKYSPDRQHSPEVPDRRDRQYSSPERQYSPEPRNHSPEDQRSFASRHSPERPYSPKYGHVFPEREYSPHSSDRQHSPERKRFPNSKYSPERPHSPVHNSQSPERLYTSEIQRSPVTKPSGPMERSSSPTLPSKSKPQKPAAQPKNVVKLYERDTKENSRSAVVSKNTLKTTSKSTKDESSSMKKSTSFEKVTTTNTERQKPASKSRKPSKETLPTYKTVTTKIIKSTEPSTETVRTKPKRTGSPSPSTSTERRRSSNISVHTEIVIDHSGPKSPKTKDATRTISKTDEDLINSLQFQKTSKKVSVTERKESAPVHRVTRKDKDAKMLRTTSEKIIKNTATSNAKKTGSGNVAQPTIAAPKQDRRPNKCLTTKSINLSTLTNNIVSSKDEDGIVIDIQHAKSSREPSPDKIVPTPVGSEVDTGKPRYPDVVQEPEDEPRRKPVVKNIAIFEEEANDFVGCQIVEVNVNKTTKQNTETERNDEILDSPTVEAPASLEYQSPERMTDDVCLLSVHDKVSKFTLSAEEDKKPKPSGKFYREIDRSQHVLEDDECLLTVDEKVHKFLKTAEKITNFTSSKEIDCSNYRPRNDDESYPGSESKPGIVNKSKTLAATSPQKSPELVANIEKQMSRQTEFMEPSEATKPTAKPSHRQEHAQRNRNETHEIDDEGEEPEELVPMTKTHTTSIELKRQKDILSRTSIFDDDKRKPTNQKQHPSEGTQKPVSSKTGKPTSRSIDSSPHRKSNDDVPENKYTEKDRKTIFTTKVSNVKQKFEPQSQTVIPKVQSTRKEKQEYKETDYEDETSETEIYQTTTMNINREVPEGNRRIPDNRPGSPMKRPSMSSKPSHKLPSASSPQYSSVTRTSVAKSNEYAVDYIPNEPLSDSEEIEQFEEDVEYNITAAGPRSDKPVPSPSRKAPSSAEEHPKQPQLVSHSPTPSHNKKVASNKVTDRTVESIQSNSRNSRRVEIEQLSGSPVQKKPQTQGRLNLSPESVAARRNLFEKGTTNAKPSKPSAGPATRTGNTTPQQGRRPSYMDHTKSSLEHIRRDSLEINKSHYSRRTSMEEEEIRYEEKPNAAVKFVIPEQQKHSKEIKMDTSEINIEEIFDLVILEQMLETVASYELRRRIRAQIRLVKKNMQNSITSTDSEVRTTEERQRVSTKETKSTGRGVNKTTATNLDNCSISPKNIRRGVATSTPTTRTTVETDEEPEMVHWQKTEITSQYSDGQVDSAYEETSGRNERTTERVPKNARTSERTATRVHVERSTKSDYNTSTQNTRSDPSIKESPKSPIWADRKNVLKNPNSKSPMKTTTTSSASVRSSNSTKTTSATSRNQQRNQVEEDSIISSYGIGPTDENGLPLFGIKALKKKPQQVQPSETTEELTGYVVEEKYYADNTTTQPIVKRKELIYSTNADKLEEIQRKLNTEAALTDDVNRQQVDGKKYASGEITMLSHDPTEEFLVSSKKYVRRGSVKEMSEKFIRKESSQSITEKSSSSSYPKAGLILRTNSRSGATDEDTSELRQNKSNRKTKYELRSSDEDDGVNYDVRESRHSARMAKESESETESVNMRKEVRRSEKSTRSFLNSSKESRVVSGVDDVLERMRNADNVQEDGDTADDQEARALLNKFLGASVIMSGVETKQTKIDASNEHSSDFDKQQVKTTRVTKTIKSGNSSSPVARKTCDIEEIWDEELLKQLLEQASSYEERRVIRARLRQLMAEREEHFTTTEKSETKEDDGAVVTTTTKVTTTRTVSQAPKPVSPFAKFKQLDKQNSQQSPKTFK